MAAERRGWATSLFRSDRSKSLCPTIYPTLLEKVEEMKKAGVPTEETSKILRGMESRFKVYRMFSEANQRQAQGLLRNGLDRRVQAMIVTVASAAILIEGCKLADVCKELYESRFGK